MVLWRHIERWEGAFLVRAHELEEARHNLTVVGLEVLELRKEVVSHPCVLLTLVLVAKWDSVSRRDELLPGEVIIFKSGPNCVFSSKRKWSLPATPWLPRAPG